MAEKEVKVRYKVLNSEFNSGIKDINSGLTTLNKEFRLQKEEMRLTGSETDKLEASLCKLSQEYDLAKQKTELTAQAFEQAKQIMGENSKEAQSWGNKLLDAQRNEERLKNSITETTQALDKSKSAMSESAQESEHNKQAIADLQNEQVQLADESKKLNSELKLQQSSMSETATDAEKLEMAEKGLAQQSELVGKQVQNLEKQLELAKKEYGENSREVMQLETALNESKTAFNQVENEMRDIKSASGDAQDGMDKLNTTMKADLLMEFGDQLQNISEKLIEMGQQALEAFREVDAGMDIITTKTGATGKPLEEMKQQAKQIATEIPADFETIGNAVGEVNTQFGLTGDALKETSKDIIRYSEINGSHVTDTSIMAKQALEAYGLSADWLGDVLDSTTMVAQGTGQSVDDLMQKTIEGAPQIKALGLEFGEGVALMGQFEQAGVDSSQALSSLSKASVIYAKDGKTLQEGLKGTIDAIMNTSDETEALNIAQEVFGTKGAVRMVDAIKRGTFSMEELSKASEEAAGKVTDTYEDTLDPIKEFEMAQNALKLVMSDIGEEIGKVLAPILKSLAGLLQKVADWFSELSEPTKEFIVIIGIIVTVLGMLAPIIAVLIAAFSVFGSVITTIIAPIALVIGVIVGLGLVLKHLWETNDQFRENVINTWNAIKEFMEPIIQSISDFVMSIWGTLTSWWNENNELIKQTINTVWGWIKTFIFLIMDQVFNKVALVWGLIQGVTQTIWPIIQGIIQGALDFILGIVKATMQLINGDWRGAWETVKQTVSQAWERIKSGVSQGVEASKDFMINGFISAKDKVASIFSIIKDTITDKINGARDAVRNGINRIKSFFNFSWSLPRLKLPHFSVSGRFSLNPPRIPSFGISWYKDGGLMTGASPFGFDGNNFHVGGEAGPEAILPLTSKILGEIGAGIVKATNITNQEYEGNTVNVYADVSSDYDVYKMVDIIDVELGKKEVRINRGLGLV
ncbi:phage tail tape measure protein [Facklamia miroungae]|uniref:Phage tail tape measure protein, TP901 family, core region n=1 Tax=Facklamia miroungae TaxID=120956 RepID=A0A1G7P0Y2_9LACT|nr:phage tail tape measure protein [Facklamia miroungae]NKZ28538.1 phage tail tape measure protein [Facklamia miroungae]SDF79767.1 phage tail tape measure protein, TP901 family, core region [Facklamia miroungae]